MQAAQACNASYGGPQYPHTYEHHIMMDPGWPGQQTGQPTRFPAISTSGTLDLRLL